MSRLDDFLIPTKEQLAKRAGYRCSFLGCGSPTFGPSEEKATGTTGIGMACHISAASGGPGARRYDKDMSSEKRKDIENGIWMCYKHGKLIDADETRFTIEILNKWKTIAERVAQIMVEKNCEYNDALKEFEFTDFTIENIQFTGLGSENEIIGNAISDCCVNVAWGRETSNAVRDFIIESIRNSFQHGKATEVLFFIENNKITISDNGKEFNPKTLFDSHSKSGGTVSVKELLNKFSSKIILATQRIDNKNVITIAKIKNQDDILDITPCSYKLTFKDFRQGNLKITISETCNEVFIVLPNYFSPSDIGMLNYQIVNLKSETRPITFITKHLSDWVISMIKEQHPNCQVLEVD